MTQVRHAREFIGQGLEEVFSGGGGGVGGSAHVHLGEHFCIPQTGASKTYKREPWGLAFGRGVFLTPHP